MEMKQSAKMVGNIYAAVDEGLCSIVGLRVIEKDVLELFNKIMEAIAEANDE